MLGRGRIELVIAFLALLPAALGVCRWQPDSEVISSEILTFKTPYLPLYPTFGSYGYDTLKLARVGAFYNCSGATATIFQSCTGTIEGTAYRAATARGGVVVPDAEGKSASYDPKVSQPYFVSQGYPRITLSSLRASQKIPVVLPPYRFI